MQFEILLCCLRRQQRKVPTTLKKIIRNFYGLTLICPITHDYIQIPAISQYGFIYEFDAISKWMDKHHTDPLNQSYHLTHWLVKMSNSNTNAELLDKAEKFSRESPQYNYVVKYQVQAKEKYQSEYRTLKSLQPVPVQRLIAPLWQDGVRYLFENIVVVEQEQNNIKCNYSVQGDFNLCHFKNCMFMQYNISRAPFLGAVFDNCVFKNCTFRGEETNFYKARGTVKFINCEFEDIANWAMQTEPGVVKQILEERLADDLNFEVIYDKIKIVVDNKEIWCSKYYTISEFSLLNDLSISKGTWSLWKAHCC